MQTLRTNLKNNASTQYTNFNAISMCRFNGVILGAGPDGLFKLCCGDNDDSTPIDAYFVPTESNFGTHTGKRYKYAYAGFRSADNLLISLTGDTDTTIGPYTIEPMSTVSNLEQRRVTLGRGMKSVYSAIKIANVNGCWFSIDNIKLYVDSNTHGHK